MLRFEEVVAKFALQAKLDDFTGGSFSLRIDILDGVGYSRRKCTNGKSADLASNGVLQQPLKLKIIREAVISETQRL
jgi:hypothetical protein